MRTQITAILLKFCSLIGVVVLSACAGSSPSSREMITDSQSGTPTRSATAFRMSDDRSSFLERYIAWLSTVPNHERAWPSVESVYQEMVQIQLDFEDEDRLSSGWHPSKSLVEGHPELADRLRVIQNLSLLGMPTNELGLMEESVDEFPPVLEVLLPQLDILRVGVELLILDAKIADNIHEIDRVLADLRAAHRLAEMGSILDVLVEGIVSMKMDSALSRVLLEGSIDLRHWDEDSLVALAAIYMPTMDWEPGARFIDGERALQQSFLNWLYIDMENGKLSKRGAQRLLNFVDNGFADGEQSGEASDFKLQVFQRIVGTKLEQEQLFDAIADAAMSDLDRPKNELTSLLITPLINEGPLGESDPIVMPVGLILADLEKAIGLAIKTRGERQLARLMIRSMLNKHTAVD